ncbi:MAG: PD-(D/E)XK nuclease family protein [Anaerolineaceae bacterium]|nr:PD-(D/E)XK nuclease family protein [Anaerolineaceae bacterium]
MENFKEASKRINQVIRECRGDSSQFVKTLKREEIPHLSFSQITTVEFCEYRYYLQYIKKETPDPLPDYFTKGSLLHQIIADTYEMIRTGSDRGGIPAEHRISTKFIGDNKRHLLNAYQIHQSNIWNGFEVVGVEHPFVMDVGGNLPPMVGVVDLILKQNGNFILVDHKSGRNFYPYDELQVAIYKKYIQTAFDGADCRLYYDHYRWVNHLDRIRKTAFQRTEVSIDGKSWPRYVKRIQQGYETIRKIKKGLTPSRDGECFRCPYRNNC